MIKSVSSSNIVRELIFNESIILMDKGDRIEFEYIKKPVKFVFRFDTSGVAYDSTVNPAKANIFDITLHQWSAKTYVETSTPWELIFDAGYERANI